MPTSVDDLRKVMATKSDEELYDFLGIPVLLAHRYYVEHGARRKARDWGR